MWAGYNVHFFKPAQMFFSFMIVILYTFKKVTVAVYFGSERRSLAEVVDDLVCFEREVDYFCGLNSEKEVWCFMLQQIHLRVERSFVKKLLSF